VENNIKEVRLSTLKKIVEMGLGGHLELSIKL
jgi:HTH-type transcriptional regulator / antitoxin HipB